VPPVGDLHVPSTASRAEGAPTTDGAGAAGFAGFRHDPAASATTARSTRVARIADLLSPVNYARRRLSYNNLMSPAAGPDTRLRQTQALLDVAESITRHGDLAALFRELVQRLQPVVPFDSLLLLLHDAEAGGMRLHLLESGRPGRVEDGCRVTPLESPGGRVFLTQEPMVVPDFAREARFPHMAPIWDANRMKSGVYLPLTTAQRRLGTVCFASHQPRAYDAADLELLRLVARQVAVAVDNALNAQAAEQLRRQLAGERDRLRLLLEVTNALVTHLDLRELFHAIAACLERVLGQAYASLALYDAERPGWRLYALHFPGGKGHVAEEMAVPFAGAPASRAFETRRPAVFDRAGLEALDSEVGRRLLAEGLQWFCSVPLVAHDRPLGALNVGRTDGADGFSPAETELLSRVADQVALAVENALAYGRVAELSDKLAQEKHYLEGEIRGQYDFAEIVGSSPAIRRVLRQAEVVAPADTPVLIQGETGTGKELIARAIHHLSGRRERTLVKLNCAAIPTGLLESELFGHERGAFTGAIERKLGRFELADKGTLFLDEVGDIPPELQPKLLRVLQEQEFERLGSTRTRKVDVRLVAATNRDLAAMVAARQFRGDLFYRLNVFPLTLPPLRERPEDIPLLVQFFVGRHARRLNRAVRSVPAEAMAALVRYPWPGNVRELENCIERAVLLSPGPELRVPVAELKAAAVPGADGVATLAEAEREHILAALRQANWKIGGPAGAAARLGMKRTTLQSRMQKLGIRRPE
jgi:formate hydrogenlyase transcriptional activator